MNSLSRLFQLQFGPTFSPFPPANRVSMESSSWSLVDSVATADPSGNWRSQLMPEARRRIVNKIADALKRHLARLIYGFGIGLAVMVVPMYISETAPSEIRGSLNKLS